MDSMLKYLLEKLTNQERPEIIFEAGIKNITSKSNKDILI